jgi:hypothetical protein
MAMRSRKRAIVISTPPNDHTTHSVVYRFGGFVGDVLVRGFLDQR